MVFLGHRYTFDSIFCTRHFAPSKLWAIPISGHTMAVSETLWKPSSGLFTASRGARSHVSRRGVFGRHRFRKAMLAQIYEHARWRRKQSGESIDVLYRKWTLPEFI
jgi:hypothetical protein